MSRDVSLICLSSLLVCLLLEVGHVSADGITVERATAPGDFIIGGIFAVHEDVDKENFTFEPHLLPCIRFDVLYLVKILGMINAIEVVNKSPLLSDLSITLGYHILDSCTDVSMALRDTVDLKEGVCSSSWCVRPVHAVIGAAHSEVSIAIARQLTLSMIPQISYSSTSAVLSDKGRFPAFMRTIPNDEHQTAAMVSLLSQYGWNWVGIITTDGSYGQSALENFVTHASQRGICVAFKSILPQSVTSQDVPSAIRLTAETILQNPKVQVIVSFAQLTLMKKLFVELQAQTLAAGQSMENMKRVWVASDSWSTSGTLPGGLDLPSIGHVVGFTFKSGDMTSFNSYLDHIEEVGQESARNNSFIEEFFMILNESRDSEESELVSRAMTKLREHTYANTIFSVELAVSAIAQAVASICSQRDCKAAGAVQPWEVLKSLRMEDFELQGKTYKFDSKGDINLGYDVVMWRSDGGFIDAHDVVAEYHPHNNSFTNSSTQNLLHLKHIISKCSKSCIPGEFKKTAEGQHTCCYECINCTENYYSNSTDMDQCYSCDTETEWSLQGSSSCNRKALLFFSWEDGFAIVLLTFSLIGIVLVLLVSALFLHQRDTPVVRAAGGPLSQAILFSLVTSFISAMLFVGRPNQLQCKARQVLFGISFTLCVSCILVKTLQILLAFQFNPELQQVLEKPCLPYVMVSICVALQAATCISWLVLKGPYNTTITTEPTTLLEDCDEGSHLAFGVMLGYIAVLAFVCFICAYKGRKLPGPYNEAKFITFSMLLYLISWLLFIPVYVTTTGVYLPAVEMVVILISNYGVLSCHFFPKCYVMLFKKEENTKSAFRRTLYEYSTKSKDAETVSEKQSSQQLSNNFHPVNNVSTTDDPLRPTDDPLRPTDHPLRPTDDPLRPEDDPLRPTDDPLRPTDHPLRPTDDPLRPTDDPLRPTDDLLRPTDDPLRPTDDPLRPEDHPLRPTDDPLRPTDDPLRPTDDPLRPEDDLLRPEDDPLRPRDDLLRPTDDPVRPTDDPLRPTDDLLRPTDHPLRPTDHPLRPTDDPLRPEDDPLRPTDNPLRPRDDLLRPTDDPLRPEDHPLRPTDDPLRPTDDPLRPTDHPLRPTDDPLRPEDDPLRPEDDPLRPRDDLLRPTDDLLRPTDDPLRPTDDLLRPTDDPVRPTDHPLRPTDDPLRPEDDPLRPRDNLLRPTDDPVRPMDDPLRPTDDPLRPTDDLLRPTDDPVRPMDDPLRPTDDPVRPTDDPVRPTDDLLRPTDDPLRPTDHPLRPTDDLLRPTDDPVRPMDDPLRPTDDPLRPTDDPLRPTDHPLRPTDDPLRPTDHPLRPTDDPLRPRDDLLRPTDDPLRPTDDLLRPTDDPVRPTDHPLRPTDDPLRPEDDPLRPRDNLLRPTDDPVRPMDDPLRPTDDPLRPTDDLLRPTDDPVRPMDDPLRPTDDPLRPTDDPLRPTDDPLRPTDHPLRPTDDPLRPTDHPLRPTDDPLRPRDDLLRPTDDPLRPRDDLLRPTDDPVRSTDDPLRPTEIIDCKGVTST